ncbi:hypothetical protein BDQ12DRAFT_687809 [Crucibulum laeve]|uniref:Uncharacterized protein n=1 Tax=Crucibulum laeve TaxID=68775 RepID=A0A5C3LSC6_9AGAR|nr:hypothetical protein BDQ12DRAFT_687809 [Crucibulum laeve]
MGLQDVEVAKRQHVDFDTDDGAVEELPLTSMWHPKLTLYRLCILSLSSGFGISKTALSYRGIVMISTTLEWIFGVVLFTLFMLLEMYEDGPGKDLAPWFFDLDLIHLTWNGVAGVFLKTNRPLYQTNTAYATKTARLRKPLPIRGYDILVCGTTVTFGLVKSVTTYCGFSTASTTLEWICGVVFMNSFYWLGLYESSPVKSMPFLFETDYSSSVKAVSVITMFAIGYTVYLGTMLFCLWWPYHSSHWILAIWAYLRKDQLHKESSVFIEVLLSLGRPIVGTIVSGFTVISILTAVLVFAVLCTSMFRFNRLSTQAEFWLTIFTPIMRFVCLFGCMLPISLTSLIPTLMGMQLFVQRAVEEPALSSFLALVYMLALLSGVLVVVLSFCILCYKEIKGIVTGVRSRYNI